MTVEMSKAEYDALLDYGIAWRSLEALVKGNGPITVSQGEKDGKLGLDSWKVSDKGGHMYLELEGYPLKEVVLAAHFMV